jgi:hypothetical protein
MQAMFSSGCRSDFRISAKSKYFPGFASVGRDVPELLSENKSVVSD